MPANNFSFMHPPGTCIICGCTESQACQTPDGPCHWVDEQKNLCSNPECVTAFASEEDHPVIVKEGIPGALIDSARISVMACLTMIDEKPRLIYPAGKDYVPSASDCLKEAMDWLDAARGLELVRSNMPVTSLHVVKG